MAADRKHEVCAREKFIIGYTSVCLPLRNCILDCLCVPVCVSLPRGTWFVSAWSSNNSIRGKGSVTQQCSKRVLLGQGSQRVLGFRIREHDSCPICYLHSNASIDVAFFGYQIMPFEPFFSHVSAEISSRSVCQSRQVAPLKLQPIHKFPLPLSTSLPLTLA